MRNKLRSSRSLAQRTMQIPMLQLEAAQCPRIASVGAQAPRGQAPPASAANSQGSYWSVGRHGWPYPARGRASRAAKAPFSFPESPWNPNPGRFMSSGFAAASNRSRSRRILPACQAPRAAGKLPKQESAHGSEQKTVEIRHIIDYAELLRRAHRRAAPVLLNPPIHEANK